MWTHFMDRYSGGWQKLDWPHIFIEAPEAEAQVIFYNRFRRDPERVTCTCCGKDYSISEHADLAQATAFALGSQTLEDYIASGRAHFIPASHIEPSERRG